MCERIITACAHCGDSFFRTWAKGVKPKYCSAACRSEAEKPAPCKCISCGSIFSALSIRYGSARWYARITDRKTCSKECLSDFHKNNQARKDKISIAFKGEKHPNWQGGKSLWNNVHGRGFNWAEQRTKALKRDGYKCVKCGMTTEQCAQVFGRNLDVDHIVPFHNFHSYKKANALSNLQSVCASCHKIVESRRSMVQMLLPMQESMSRQHRPNMVGERHPRAIMNYAKADEARAMVADGMTYKAVGDFFGVDKSTIGLIVRRKLWVR